MGESNYKAGILAAGMLACASFSAVAYAAEVDLAGEWTPLYHEDAPERVPGPELGNYTGLPLNDAARQRADSYDPDRISVVQEYQCRPHSADYSLRGLGNLRISKEVDSATQRTAAYRTRMFAWDNERTIYMDGRPPPPANAPYTWQGFSTGKWQGNTLVITTTHLKPNYLRRNGIPRSDRATLTEHWIRHGDYLTIVSVVVDPAFLSEPLVRSQNWYLNPSQTIRVMGCEYTTEIPQPRGSVPHYMPGTNHNLKEFGEMYGLPFELTRGGAETLYPEYRAKMTGYRAPDRCPRYCGRRSNLFGD
jgi:hypothetical protein